MAYNLFQIERSRKIVIAIPGYDPVFEIQKINKRFKQLGDKQKRRQALAAQKHQETLQAQLKEQEVALDELNKGKELAQAGSVQGSQSETKDNLFA